MVNSQEKGLEVNGREEQIFDTAYAPRSKRNTVIIAYCAVDAQASAYPLGEQLRQNPFIRHTVCGPTRI